MRTPLGETKIPLPMMEPTMTVTPLRRVILAFSSTFSSPALLAAAYSRILKLIFVSRNVELILETREEMS